MAAAVSDSFKSECNKCLCEVRDRKLRLSAAAASDGENVHFLAACQGQLDKLEGYSLDTSLEESSRWQDWLRALTQAILDITFYEESLLVDNDFLEDGPDVHVTLAGVLLMLDYPEKLVGAASWDVKDVLGVDIVECLFWRKGSLCYSYCATLAADDATRLEIQKASFLQQARNGVGYFKTMFSLRDGPKKGEGDFLSSDSDALTLAQEGVFSSTHVLALMYCGELCYWVLQHDKDRVEGHRSPDLLAQIGSQSLDLYLKMASGPLRNQGWNVCRAQELLGVLRQANG